MLITSYSRLSGTFSSDSSASTSFVAICLTGSCAATSAASDASGVIATKLVAASAAAAMTYGRETACTAPPLSSIYATIAELTLRESKFGQNLKQFDPE